MSLEQTFQHTLKRVIQCKEENKTRIKVVPKNKFIFVHIYVQCTYNKGDY